MEWRGKEAEGLSGGWQVGNNSQERRGKRMLVMMVREDDCLSGQRRWPPGQQRYCRAGGGNWLVKAGEYEGLSEKFLSSPVPKLLLLAGTDRLDRTLTIGQMQGKFQMVVVRHTGHAIQEDVPEEFATLVLNFISRNRIGPHGIEIPGLRRPSQ
ncbi:hypothetical protein KSS87_001471 [Heliosperma pusillum]|nr:hypothetical protein KSS87_001471 [Heliosperma pusillum]